MASSTRTTLFRCGGAGGAGAPAAMIAKFAGHVWARYRFPVAQQMVCQGLMPQLVGNGLAPRARGIAA